MNRRKFLKSAAIASGLIYVPKAFAQPFSLDDPAMLVNGATAASSAPSPTLGWWKFDEGTGSTTADSSGAGNTGTLVGSPTWQAGPHGNDALAFTTSSWVTTTLLTITAAAGSVTWWHNQSDAYNSGNIRCPWGQNNGSSSFDCQKFSDSNWYVGWLNARVSVAATALTWPVSTWQFYAFTWQASGSAFVYNNNVSIGTNSTAPSVSNLNTAFDIARQGTSGAARFAGAIDDLRIYNVALTSAQITAIYNAGAQ
jgi:hypothetical protein